MGKTRNIIAIFAIALTGMLFTALFTVGIGLADNIQKQTMRSAGGDWHGVFKNITREQYDTLKKFLLLRNVRIICWWRMR